MSANSPDKIYISGDDVEYGETYNEWTYTLGNTVVGATGIDIINASIPNTEYPIPDYQNKFYYSMDTAGSVIQTITLSNDRNFTNVADLVAQLNIDASGAFFPLTFSYNTTTNRVSVESTVPSGSQYLVVNNLNKTIVCTGMPNVVLTEGYYTLAEFLTEFQTKLTASITSVAGFSGATCTVSAPGNILTITTTGTSGHPGVIIGGQTIQVQLLIGWAGKLNEPIDNPSPPITGTAQLDFNSALSFRIAPKSKWLTPFALNTRLGFTDNPPNVVVNDTITGTIMPNILRTRTIYILLDAIMNSSLTTDGSRGQGVGNVLARVPVNAVYGGLITYENTALHYLRQVPKAFQNLRLSLLDENLQPLGIAKEEIWEVQLAVRYDTVE